MSDRLTYCDIMESCEECPRYGRDCDGDKRDDDLIRRADAIAAMCNDCGADNGDFYPNCEQKEYCAEVQALVALPSAEAEWIPCGEKLPKEYAQYLVCLKSGECYVYWLKDSDWARGMAEKEGILAWMPLPKPYREDGEA